MLQDIDGKIFNFVNNQLKMASQIVNDFITCESCGLKFERCNEYKFCSNCFACTGCEIYYCPDCDEEIIVKPVRKISRQS